MPPADAPAGRDPDDDRNKAAAASGRAPEARAMDCMLRLLLETPTAPTCTMRRGGRVLSRRAVMRPAEAAEQRPRLGLIDDMDGQRPHVHHETDVVVVRFLVVVRRCL